jgi:hypothetical protein
MTLSQAGVSPPKLGGVAVRSRKAALATLARTDGVVPNFLRKEELSAFVE